MPCDIREMRELMLPGLLAATSAYYSVPVQWDTAFKTAGAALPSLPGVGPVALVALGAAAVVIKNPVVTRRLFFMKERT